MNISVSAVYNLPVPCPALLCSAALPNEPKPHQPIDKRRLTVLITGGSAGLGLEIARVFACADYEVILVGRSADRLRAAAEQTTRADGTAATSIAADVTNAADCDRIAAEVRQRFGRLDTLINCVGVSDRGLARELSAERVHELIDVNVVAPLQCTRALLPLLEASRGSIVNIGSLAGKVGARYLGGYNLAKHALAGLTQQLRLELRDRGVHVGLVSPGPIRRDDAGARYADRTSGTLPDKAAAPGGGTKVKGLEPERVARAVYQCVQRRQPDVVLPGYLRILIAIGHASPPLGDWLLLKFTA